MSKRLKNDVVTDKNKSGQKTDHSGATKSKEESKGIAPSDKEEEKVSAEGVRRSSRNVGKEANYNIDDILDAADQINNGSVGGGSINVMLAGTYNPEEHDPTGWYMSEKLDGVRCYWNGSGMYTRNGHIFYPPDWFKKELPADLCLDGELWTGRADF